MKKKVLITGGTGILSSDVCIQALNQGFDVYILNRGMRKYRLDPRANLIICDIRKESVETIREKLSGQDFDTVIDFLSMVPNNVEKMFRIIEGHCDQYILISSATVYKKQNENEVITENTPIGNDKWDYARNKAACEKYASNSYRQYCKHITIIRPYVTYGVTRIPYAIIPGDNWTLANRILLGKPVILWNHGENICTITNTTDFAAGVVGLFGNPKAFEEAFHITSDCRMTWKEVLNDIEKALGKKAVVADIDAKTIVQGIPEYEGVLYGDKGTNMVFSDEKIKKAVPEFSCKVSFKDGICDTIAFYRANPKLQSIDYAWDGRIDCFLAKYYKNDRVMREKLNSRVYTNITPKERIRYLENRYDALVRAHYIVNKIRGK